MTVRLTDDVIGQFIKVAQAHDLYLEGGILNLVEVETETPEHTAYIEKAKSLDKERRKERLEFTKGVQRQNKELMQEKERNASLMEELKEEKEKAEQAFKTAKNDLDYLQRKTQFQLVGNIVTAALRVIIGVGIITTIMYAIALFVTEDAAAVTLLGNTWSNLFGILLTNSFSIIGTIMGVKYATEQREEPTA
jgi:hypothetical protein